MKRLRAILSITAVRLSLAYGLIFGLVTLLTIFYVAGSSTGEARRQIEASIDAEAESLSLAHERRGLNALVRRLELSATAPGANLYIVADSAGEILAGNAEWVEIDVLLSEGWLERPFAYGRFGDRTGDRPRYALGRVSPLPNGMRLMIAKDMGEFDRLDDVVGRAMLLALATILVLGLATWALVGRRALKRLDLVSKSTSRIMAGDRSERLPVSGAGDEFDRLSIRLNEMLEQIFQLDEGIRRVSDNIAHDLKTPLTRLRNKAHDALEASAGKKRAIQEIIDDTDRIIRTFDALLTISRIEAGANAASFVEFDLSALAEDAVDLYQPAAEEDGFNVEVDIEGGLAVNGSRELLFQALSNLVENAIKYGASDSGSGSLSISARREGECVSLCVADRGEGIAEENRARVVQRFFRLDQSRSHPGSGLGLSLASAIAGLHGGKLEFFDNAPGLKACIILPRKGEENESRR